MVVVGDGDCGKTCLLHRFAQDEFYTRYIPTVFEVQTKKVPYKGQEVELVMYDTAGQEDYDRLRPFSYTDTDVIIVCFSLDNPDSLTNVLLNWVPEVRYYCGKVPLLLVGTKKDLRDEASGDWELADVTESSVRGTVPQFVHYEEGLAVASKADAEAYYESSAKTGEGTATIFDAVVRYGFENKFNKPRSVFRKKKS
nr:hypothetical protein BaRGS_018802 [Batillaria attramentaria]